VGPLGTSAPGQLRCDCPVCVQEEEEERSLIKDLKRYARLAVAWDRHGSLVPRCPEMEYEQARGIGRAWSSPRRCGVQVPLAMTNAQAHMQAQPHLSELARASAVLRNRLHAEFEQSRRSGGTLSMNAVALMDLPSAAASPGARGQLSQPLAPGNALAHSCFELFVAVPWPL